MPAQPASRLRDYPYMTVRLACSKCDRQERFGKDRLIAAHGFDVTMHDLQHLIAKCDRTHNRKTSCGAFYPDLMND